MEKIKNFDVLVNNSLWNLNIGNKGSAFDKNDFLLSVINGFEDGHWRKKEFDQFVMNNIVLTGLSAGERESLYSDSIYTQLTESVNNLRLVDNDYGEGSEIAEIVLYGIMRYHYDALPVVPKIFYKQNTQDNAKGADSVHIVLDDKGDFTLWLGEAKFYNEISDSRLYEPVKSVFSTISTDKIKKENSIITNIRDLEYVITNPSVRRRVKSVLSKDTSIDEIKKRLHVPILLLHECKVTEGTKELTEEYIKKIKTYHINRANRYFNIQNNHQKEASIYGYEGIKFHLILFPVPNKNDIVKRFVKRVKQIKEDA